MLTMFPVSSVWCLEAASFCLNIGKEISEKDFHALIGGPSVAIEILYFWILQSNHDLPEWWNLTG